jgi:hypothetical protein
MAATSITNDTIRIFEGINITSKYPATTLKYGSLPKPTEGYIQNKHDGQRKLMMTEVYFLTKYSRPDKSQIVVYVGSGFPGKHIPLLITMFPGIYEFHLIDPLAYKSANIVKGKGFEHVKNLAEYFTDEMAMTYKRYAKDIGKDILFISDIRETKEIGPSDADVIGNMNQQAVWHRLLGAEWSMLKYRLPYEPENFKTFEKYLSEAEMIIQPWARANTGETRVIVAKGARMKKIPITKDGQRYLLEDQMYWHRIFGRPARYSKDSPFFYVPEGLSGRSPKRVAGDDLFESWDDAAEYYIYQEYVRRFYGHAGFTEKDILRQSLRYFRQMSYGGEGRATSKSPKKTLHVKDVARQKPKSPPKRNRNGLKRR